MRGLSAAGTDFSLLAPRGQPMGPMPYRQPMRTRPAGFLHLPPEGNLRADRDASGLPSDKIVIDGRVTMERHFVANDINVGSARFHHILESDPGGLFHDHPWDFVSVILDGSYVESTPGGEQTFVPGDVLVRRAEWLHRLTLVDGPVWSFVTTGPVRRRWGFQTPAGWVYWKDHVATP